VNPLELPGEGKETSVQDSCAAMKLKLMAVQPTLAADTRSSPMARRTNANVFNMSFFADIFFKKVLNIF
jgi:hypothetical protein